MSPQPLEIERYFVPSADWRLDVRRHLRPDRLNRALKPLLLIPGYCMNTKPLGFHPTGPSMIELLAERGFEVWTANLRHQGDSEHGGAGTRAGFSDLALVDLPNAIAHVARETRTERDRVDLIGCSLGGTYIFVYLAHNPASDAIGSVVAIGAPLSWTKPHALLKLAFASPKLAGRLKIAGTRRFAKLALPLLARRLPRALWLYMNTECVDLSCADELVETVEDPIPALNEEIARWVTSGKLVVDGVDVTRALSQAEHPLLAVVANRDGIVPPDCAKSALDVMKRSDLLEVGDETTWFAHADLFISRHAQERVFEPLARWLREKQAGA